MAGRGGRGHHHRPGSSWDGYAAAAVTDAALEALRTGQRTAVVMLERPESRRKGPVRGTSSCASCP